MTKAAARSGAYDIIGHLDGMKTKGHIPALASTPLLEETVRALAESDVAIELNTSGWRKEGCVRTGYTGVDNGALPGIEERWGGCHAAKISPSRVSQRARKRHRWSLSETRSCVVVRARKYWRCSSWARQKRPAAVTLPKPRMG